MRDPAELYEVHLGPESVPRGLDLVAGVPGFVDAGGAVSQFTEFLLDEFEHRTVIRFDNDELLDWRARRPVMAFDGTHLTDYRPASLAVHLVEDEVGAPFLLLAGYEPDLQWERFAAAMLRFVEDYGVARTTWVHAIAMPVPHTRPLGVTVSGNRSELTDAMSIWRPRTEFPGTALHLVEFRLQAIDHPTTGFVILVPHYLGEAVYPAAAVTALESITAATGLLFPTDSLRAAGREFAAKIDEQLDGNEELARLISTLETRHDSYVEDNPLPSPLTELDGSVPSADRIADELQQFLASRRLGDDEPQR